MSANSQHAPGCFHSAATPTGVKRLLNAQGIAPKKHLGQNFLIDRNLLAKIVLASNLSSDDYIFEIGPGPGALTEHLLASGATVFGLEKDPDLCALLSRLESPAFELTCGDFLALDLRPFLRDRLPPHQKGKVISNIPYHLTTPILQRLLPLNDFFSSITLMMQKEVAQRCVAQPKSKDYSALSLFTHAYSNPKILFDIPPSAFYPPPLVTSTVVHFTLKPFPSHVSPDCFFSLIKCAFQKRRKMLRRSLTTLESKKNLVSILSSLSLSPQARPEELSLTSFLNLALRLQHQVEKSCK